MKTLACALISLMFLLVACGNDPGNTRALDGGGSDSGPDPAAACEEIHQAYNHLEAQCFRAADSLYSSVPGNPAHCDEVTTVTRLEDVSVCANWLVWPAAACGELYDGWRPTANCVDLFR